MSEPRAAESPHGDASDATAGDAERRAEELVERAGREVSRFLARVVVRTREEVEDIWAEAQEERRSGGSPPDRR